METFLFKFDETRNASGVKCVETAAPLKADTKVAVENYKMEGRGSEGRRPVLGFW